MSAHQNTIVLELGPDAATNNGRNSEGSFVTLKDGRIAFAYSKYTANNFCDNAPCEIVCRYSSDAGRTWSSEDRVLVEQGDADNVMSVSLLRLHDGCIMLVYLYKKIQGDGIIGIPMARFSDDELETLSEAVPLFRTLNYNCVDNDRVVQLSSGRIVVPMANHRLGLVSRPSDNREIADSDQWMTNAAIIVFMLSDDGGQTWFEASQSLYKGFPGDLGLQEPGVLELKDGRVWCWARTAWAGEEEWPRQWESFSADGASTWTEPQSSGFVSPHSPMHVKRIPGTGDILAVWNDLSGRFPFVHLPGCCQRTPLVSAISRDEGQTWERHFVVEDEPDHGYCYTAIYFADDAVLMAYCAGGASTSTPLDKTRMRRIPLADIYGSAEDYEAFKLAN